MKRILQTVFALSLLAVLSLNFSSGAAAGGMALSGSPVDEKLANGNPRTCQACHFNGSFNPSLRIEVLNEAGSAAVKNYVPGTIYTIRLAITASGSPSFGFQMLDLRKSDNVNTKGFKAAGTQAMGIQVSTLNNREYAEHSRRLTTNMIDVKWKAPATNVGPVIFYAVGNAVNGNSNESGDNGTAAVSLEFKDPITAGVNELAQNVKMELTPNPVTEGINLVLKSEKSRLLRVQVADIAGRIVATDNWQITAGNNQKTVDLSRFAKGAYMVQLIENQDIISKKIFKL